MNKNVKEEPTLQQKIQVLETTISLHEKEPESETTDEKIRRLTKLTEWRTKLKLLEEQK